jgi:hypothetical protein
MLDPTVRPWKYDCLVPVVVTDEIRRRTVGASRLDDDRCVLMNADHVALNMKMVAHDSSHGSSVSFDGPSQQFGPSGACVEEHAVPLLKKDIVVGRLVRIVSHLCV